MERQKWEARNSVGPMACLFEGQRILAQEEIGDPVDKSLIDSHKHENRLVEYEDWPQLLV